MNYGIYKNVRNAAWNCLIDCDIRTLPIQTTQITADHGIQCKKANDIYLGGHSGKILEIGGQVYILCNSNDTAPRQRYTIMHELGHYLLGHLGETPLSRSESECRTDEEQAADKFAIDMLAPACVLWGLQIHTAEEIARVCHISMQAAQYRAKRMELLYQRNMFLTHPLERQVYEQFRDFISRK